MNEISTIITISAIIILSPYISKISKIPIAPIEITIGSLAAFAGFLGENHLFELLAEVGFFYLMFLAGMEVDLRILLNLNKDTIKRGFLYISFLYLISFLSYVYLDLGKIFIVIMPLISVGLILPLYKEYGKNKRWLNTAMTIGVLGEIVSIGVLTFVGSALEFGIGSTELYKTLGYLTLFILSVVVLFRIFKVLFWWYPELKVLLMPYSDKDEKDIRLSMAIFFIMIAVMLFLHLEIAFGAFIAGIFIATFFGHKSELPHKLSSFGFGFLVPIFFVYIGTTFKLEAIMIDGLIYKALLITALMIGMRVFSSFVLFLNSLKAKERILFGLSHSMPLTLLIAVATIAYSSNSMDRFHYYSFILASLFEVVISMISIKIVNSGINISFLKDKKLS